jgi:hypothetical protein
MKGANKSKTCYFSKKKRKKMREKKEKWREKRKKKFKTEKEKLEIGMFKKGFKILEFCDAKRIEKNESLYKLMQRKNIFLFPSRWNYIKLLKKLVAFFFSLYVFFEKSLNFYTFVSKITQKFRLSHNIRIKIIWLKFQSFSLRSLLLKK